MNTKQIGKILWWSERDGNGVISDSLGNEYYFDNSVVNSKIIKKLERGTLLVFVPSRCDNVLVAKSINIPTSRSLSKYEEQLKYEQTQMKLPFAI